VQHFGVKGKLAPRYIGPYEVTEKFGTVAYRIRLPDRLFTVHDVFHISQLKKCEQIPEAQIIEETNAKIEPDLSLAEYPMRILDQNERKTRRQKVKMYKINGVTILLTVNFRQPSHEFTFNVGIDLLF
jgi:hypothetical protein